MLPLSRFVRSRAAFPVPDGSAISYWAVQVPIFCHPLFAFPPAASMKIFFAFKNPVMKVIGRVINRSDPAPLTNAF